MTNKEKLALVATLLECVAIGYFKHKSFEAIVKKSESYFEEEAKRVAARQRQKFYENATESNRKNA